MIKKWQTINSEIVFNHKWFILRKDTVELPNGKVLDDYIVSERPDVVLVFPITADNNVVMVEQYKHAANDVLLEFPGGFFLNKNEASIDAAQRELLEETGYASDNIEEIATVFDNPTKDCNKTHLYIAYNCKKIQSQNLDISEDINVKLIPLNKIEEKLLNNEVKATLSIALGLMALKKLV